MDKLGVLPAAGLCSRWNGTFKELLPAGENKWIIDFSIDAMRKAEITDFVIITSPSKISSHIAHFKKDKYKGLNINYVIQYEPDGLVNALKLGCKMFQNYDNFYFSMPDTIFSDDVFQWGLDCFKEIRIGLFQTCTPSRFGIIESFSPVHIIDKPQNLDNNKIYTAWGTIVWGNYFNALLCNMDWENYTVLLNQYCSSLPHYNRFAEIKQYNDIASWKDYEEWIRLN